MAAHVTKVETVDLRDGEGLYMVHFHLDRHDQKGGPKHEMKFGLDADFVDGLDRNQVADLLRHEIVKRIFEGLGK